MGDQAATGEIRSTVMRRGGRSKRVNEYLCSNPVKGTESTLQFIISPSHGSL